MLPQWKLFWNLKSNKTQNVQVFSLELRHSVWEFFKCFCNYWMINCTFIQLCTISNLFGTILFTLICSSHIQSCHIYSGPGYGKYWMYLKNRTANVSFTTYKTQCIIHNRIWVNSSWICDSKIIALPEVATYMLISCNIHTHILTNICTA